MKKLKVKLILDILMFFNFLILAVSGFYLAKKFEERFIFLREQWLTIHYYAGVILVLLLIIHLCLNWVWIKNMLKSLFWGEIKR
jgi:hypothetical protein